MAEILVGEGVAAGRLILDEASLDTLENCAAVAAQVRRGGYPYVLACTDRYHLPRVCLLLRLMGVASRPGPAGAGPPFWHGLGMVLREMLALPHSVLRFLIRPRP